MISRVKTCFHESNLPTLFSLPGRACSTSPGWVTRKFLPGWATADYARDLWLTGRSIFREVARIRGHPLSLSPLPKSRIQKFFHHPPSLPYHICHICSIRLPLVYRYMYKQCRGPPGAPRRWTVFQLIGPLSSRAYAVSVKGD